MKTLSPAVRAMRWRLFDLMRTPGRNRLTPERAVELMSVECLPDPKVPRARRAGVTAFRHLRHDARLRLAQRFFTAHGAQGNRPCVWCAR